MPAGNGKVLTARLARAMALSAILISSACAPLIANRGYLPDAETIAEIRPFVDNKKSIIKMLGFPSSEGTFDETTWYYISRRTRNFAFFDETLMEQSILQLNFDDEDYVTSLVTHGIEGVRDVDLVERKTPTRGKKLTFFEQLFGNVGKFNKETPTNQQGGN